MTIPSSAAPSGAADVAGSAGTGPVNSTRPHCGGDPAELGVLHLRAAGTPALAVSVLSQRLIVLFQLHCDSRLGPPSDLPGFSFPFSLHFGGDLGEGSPPVAVCVWGACVRLPARPPRPRAPDLPACSSLSLLCPCKCRASSRVPPAPSPQRAHFLSPARPPPVVFPGR